MDWRMDRVNDWWLSDWLTEGPTDWLPDLRTDNLLTDRRTGQRTVRLIDSLTEWLTEKLDDWLNFKLMTVWLIYNWLTDWIHWLSDWQTSSKPLCAWYTDWFKCLLFSSWNKVLTVLMEVEKPMSGHKGNDPQAKVSLKEPGHLRIFILS